MNSFKNGKVNVLNMKIWISTIIYIALFIGYLPAQSFKKYDVPIYNNYLFFPLLNSGGLRSPQFSNIDLNGDGIQDIFIFDKNGDVIIPMIKTGEIGSLDYKYAPEYISKFPKLQSWALLVDYNNDGIKDIFTSSSTLPNCCVEVWKGNRDAQGDLYYEKVTFTGLPFRDILQFKLGGSYTNIYVSAVDLPAIVDVDGDGDVDIVSFEPDGSYASFYKNMTVEDNLNPDEFRFIRQDICWGKFAENQYNEKLSLSNSQFSCASPFRGEGNTGVRHSGSTLTIFDTNGDGLMDLIIGDIDSPKLAKLINGGTKENAWMKGLELDFPIDDVSVDLGYFISAFYVDVDGDDIRDLIVAPNDISIGENRNHIWLYKNIGTDISPIFNLIKKDFLIDQMPYFYGGSHPAFADVNGDGLVDMIIGTSSIIKRNNTYENRLILLINTGKETQPIFHVADEDYLGFSKITQYVGRLAPFVADIDDDGSMDLFVGDASGQLYFFKNLALKGDPFLFDNPVYPYFDIFVGQNAKPFVIDLDGDGLKDLVIGKKNNELNYFKNQGTIGNPFFNSNPGSPPNVRQLGQIFGSNDYYTQNGAPFIINLEDESRILLLGSEAANIKAYLMHDGPEAVYELVADNLGNVFEGRKVVPALYDLDNDGYYEMAVGNERGGLTFYKTDFKVGKTSSIVKTKKEIPFIVYPNPARNQIYVSCGINDVDIQLRDLYGRALKSLANHDYTDIGSDIPEGIYFISFHTSEGVDMFKLIISK